MKTIMASFLTLAVCAASYGVEIYDNTGGYQGVHYIYNTDNETVSESIDGSVAGYPKPDWIKINYASGGNASKNEKSMTLTVANGVNVVANTQFVTNNATVNFMGNNNINLKSLSAKFGGTIYVGKDSIFHADEMSLNSDATIIFDGVKDITVGYMTKIGAVNNDTENESTLILRNGSTMTIERANKYTYINNIGANVRLEEGSVLNINSKVDTNSEIYVGSGATLNVAGSLKTRQDLIVASDAKVNAKSSITFDNLVVEFDENITQDLVKDFDFSSIFGENATVVTSALDNNFTIVGKNGTFDASFDSSTGDIVVPTAPVPEPATVAALLGAVALSFAVFRRRK